ncbi:PDZ domain-containing protein [Granulosicoccaceae sp. 1_MG-2023]|nr:PDZ domain-containing protein [Granulosicoccaceae sp. 1_MG-2023]
MSVHYQIIPENPAAHLYRVRLSVTEPAGDGQGFALPNWIPGSYMIRDFSKNIVTLEASCNGVPVALEKLDKSRWRAAPVQGTLELDYLVYAWDLSVRTAHLDENHGFFNGTSVFLSVDGQENAALSVEIVPPPASLLGDWQVATAMHAEEVDARGFGRYRADDYDELIDHPVEMGTFTRVKFTACEVPHEIVLTGRFDADLERLAADLKTICEHHINFFGRPAPMSRYVFLVMVVGEGYGGLEHRASTALLASRKHLPYVGMQEISDDYLEFLGLCSHEYFHTWNVKRIKPAAFTPYQLQQESYTRLLWAFEGITSYYDDLALVRCGLIGQERYLKLLGRMITRVWRGSGRFRQSVADSSFDAWNKFYKQDENAPNAIVSYYAKGAVIAAALDATMRERSGGKVSLDDLMRQLWDDWQVSGRGLGEDEVEALAAKLTGVPLDDFFDQAVRGTDDPALGRLFASLGIDVHWRPASSRTDAGGEPAQEKRTPLSLGARYRAHAKGLEITHVLDGGAAQKAGLSAGDVVVAVDEMSTDPGLLDALIERRQSGDTLIFHYFRLDALYTARVVLQPAAADTCYLTISDSGRDTACAWLAPAPRAHA